MEPSEELFKEIILDHFQHPRNYNLPINEASALSAEAKNPICGDQYSIHLKITNNTIQKITFSGQGCAISKASASIMTELLQGLSIQKAHQLHQQFNDFLLNNSTIDILELQAFSGIKQYPDRIHCAQLAWNILDSILKKIPT